MPTARQRGDQSPGGASADAPTAAQFMQLLQQQQQQLQAQNENIERLINALPNATPPGTTGTTATTTPTLPETKPTAHGDHHPPKTERADFMRNEKVLVEHLSEKRLEPYNESVEYQIEELGSLILTPLAMEPSKWKSMDAYHRQSNRLEDLMEEFIDNYRRQHPDWKTAGGSVLTFCYKGQSADEGLIARTARQAERTRLEHDPNVGLKYPIQEEFKQDMMIVHPYANTISGDYCLHHSDGTPRYRLIATQAEIAAADVATHSPADIERITMRISNDPRQAPYLGRFAAGRALDSEGFVIRDQAMARIFIHFSEQAHVQRAELK